MTNIELQAAHSSIAANNEIISFLSKKDKVDWDERRYEIAKTVLPQCIATCNEILRASGKLTRETLGKTVAYMAVEYANTLIEELKKHETK